MISHPMFACSENITLEMLEDLIFPVAVTIKEDGIRMLCGSSDGEVKGFSRTLRPLPNIHVQAWCRDEGIPGLDGEIIVPHWDFNDIQSWVMTTNRLPINWTYRVFDWHVGGQGRPYLHRMQLAKNMVENYGPSKVILMMPTICNTPDEVAMIYRGALRKGREGIIIRSLDGPYKQGRSTMNEGYMLKMKAFEDDEAKIIGFVPEYKNLNAKTVSRLGKSKRSSHQANKVAQQVLGAFIVEHPTKGVFNVAGGMTRDFRIYVWAHKSEFKGQWLTYKWQAHGSKHKPRTPIAKGVRRD